MSMTATPLSKTSAAGLPNPAEASRARAHSNHRPERLWLALYLPRLALEAVSRCERAAFPLAAIDGHGVEARVVALDDRAKGAGVRLDMCASAACALVPRLELVTRDPTLEASALEGLALWCQQFTSVASLMPGAGLLLEVGGSLKLFGDLSTLHSRICTGVGQLGYTVLTGVAPTAQGAWLLARAGLEQPATSSRSLSGRLATVPVQCMDLPEETLRELLALGLRHFGDCCRLPRGGTTRRLGPALLDLVDRALGRQPDPRASYVAPAVFERRLSLPSEVEEIEPLLFAARRVLLELSGFLRARSAGVRSLEVHLAHRGAPATRLVVELVAATRDPRHLLLLLRERLERLELVKPVEYLAFRARELIAFSPEPPDLYGGEGRCDGDWHMLVERLQARLGRAAVQGLATVADHRPECTWRAVDLGEGESNPRKNAPVSSSARPLWLLETPRRLDSVHGRPWHDGELDLQGGPERIESGWWDGHDVMRDYYLARGVGGERYWIYRELRGERRWFLHGIFA